MVQEAGDVGIPAPTSHSRGYTTWQQVAGYFDGDGCPKIHVGDVTLHVTVSWSDQDKELLEHIGHFLSQKGITWRLGNFHRGADVYYELSVTEGGGNALKVLRSMLPYLDKKWSQVDAAVSYLENKTTGDAFIKVLNEAVIAKRRSSSIIEASMPYSKAQAIYLIRTRPRPNHRSLTQGQVLEARRLREALGLSYAKLGEKYGVPEGTIYWAMKYYR